MLLNTPLLMKETPWKVLWQITLERAGRTWSMHQGKEKLPELEEINLRVWGEVS